MLWRYVNKVQKKLILLPFLLIFWWIFQLTSVVTEWRKTCISRHHGGGSFDFYWASWLLSLKATQVVAGDFSISSITTEHYFQMTVSIYSILEVAVVGGGEGWGRRFTGQGHHSSRERSLSLGEVTSLSSTKQIYICDVSQPAAFLAGFPKMRVTFFFFFLQRIWGFRHGNWAEDDNNIWWLATNRKRW